MTMDEKICFSPPEGRYLNNATKTATIMKALQILLKAINYFEFEDLRFEN
jgi:hypothetical protein